MASDDVEAFDLAHGRLVGRLRRRGRRPQLDARPPRPLTRPGVRTSAAAPAWT
jgi:hypothetical protein